MGKLLIGFFIGVASTSVAFLIFGEADDAAQLELATDTPQREDAATRALEVEELTAEVSRPETAEELDAIPEVEAAPSEFPPYDPDGGARNPDGSLNAPRMRALPGTPGFEVLLPPPQPPQAVELLAAEARDPDWAGGWRPGLLLNFLQLPPRR